MNISFEFWLQFCMNIEWNQFKYQFNEKMNIQNIPSIATQNGQRPYFTKGGFGGQFRF